MDPLSILILEPYAAVSHQLLWEGLARHSRHRIEIETLPPRRWKFRMRTASFHFASLLQERADRGDRPPDLFVCSEYLSLAEFLSLLPVEWRSVPAVVYFHENQLTYPLQGDEKRDLHYAYSHLHAGLVAERVLFNSAYHRDAFIGALPELLRLVPDVDVQGLPGRFAQRSSVLPLGTDIPRIDRGYEPVSVPTVLWSHRWEYDKAPDLFLEAIETLRSEGRRFRVQLLGQRFREAAPELEALQTMLGEDLVGDGFIEDREAYLAAVCAADIVVSTARHEFFGLSTLEALRSGLLPVLPDDLAYPELLPEEARVRPYLYPRSEGLAPSLDRALDLVIEWGEVAIRRAIRDGTDRYQWSALIGEYDDLFAEAVGGISGARLRRGGTPRSDG